MLLYSIVDFIDKSTYHQIEPVVTHWYQGVCPSTGKLLRLPRTLLAEKIAFGLMEQFKTKDIYSLEGKMYGILLVETNQGKLGVIKAFSGLLKGQSNVSGWVPSIPGRSLVTLAENFTLIRLEEIKQEITALKNLAQREEYQNLFSQYQLLGEEMKQRHQKNKQERHQKRELFSQTLSGKELLEAIAELEAESRRDGREKRNLKRHWNPILHPLKDLIVKADQSISELKQQRKLLSRQLQSQMQATYSLTNFAGNTSTLSQLIGKSFIPTGTGACCAPKLLHYAATHSLKPLAMAEFWWGKSSANGDKIAGNFYGACVERCQPLMGFLLSGLASQSSSTSIITQKCSEKGRQKRNGEISTDEYGEDHQLTPLVYEDEDIIVVNKPAGLLSVSGRGSQNFDSVESRLQLKYSSWDVPKAVHRLDQDTSGLLILAKNLSTYKLLSRQFAEKKVHKIYEAMLAGHITREKGTIDLPLWGNPEHRPLQEVNWHQGKPSLTYFQVINQADNYTRLEFMPITGRTHQIRVHAASSLGLGVSIQGDRLYGYNQSNNDRLYLHAREISFVHPQSEKSMELKINTPF